MPDRPTSDRTPSDRTPSDQRTPTALLGDTVALAARRLAESGGDVLLVLGPRARPWGAVTCRDMVVRCLATGRDPDRMTLSELLMGEFELRARDATAESRLCPGARNRAETRLDSALGILRRELARLGGPDGDGADGAGGAGGVGGTDDVEDA